MPQLWQAPYGTLEYEMPNVLTIDLETGETVEREMTAEEIAALPEASDDAAKPE